MDVIVSKYFMFALKLFTVVFKRSDRSISFERVDVTAIRVVRNTLSLSRVVNSVIIGQNSLVGTHLGKISVQGLLYDNNQSGEILN